MAPLLPFPLYIYIYALSTLSLFLSVFSSSLFEPFMQSLIFIKPQRRGTGLASFFFGLNSNSSFFSEMGSQPFERWSNVEVFPKDEDFGVLSFPTQPLRLDFSGSSGYADAAAADIDHQLDYLPIQESAFDAVPMDAFVYDPSYSVLDFEPSPNVLQGGDFCSGFVDDFRGWNHHHQEMMHFEFNMEENQPLLLCDGSSQGGLTSVEEVPAGKKIRRPREVKGSSSSSSSALSRQTISKYFYMPITQAARELNIGLTLLKKRCRELGIRRWPHRKLMSLQTLIKNVQEMQNGVGGHMAENKLRETINILEHEKKLMEEIPDMELEGQTKRLRQACFKANYKKRKLVGIVESQASLNKVDSVAANNPEEEEECYNDEEEDLDSIFADCLSSSNSIIYQT